MDDLISRQAAIAHAISGLTREFEGEKWIRVSEVRESLQTMPSAERHGRWEKVDDNPYEYVAACSVCRNEVKQPTCMLKPIYSYCPICGALMDKDKE